MYYPNNKVQNNFLTILNTDNKTEINNFAKSLTNKKIK
jgi:hypothetical protein